jgi:hypothetical protein
MIRYKKETNTKIESLVKIIEELIKWTKLWPG